MSTAKISMTYYLDIMSSWCTYVDPLWDELQQSYAGRVNFDWKIALMNREAFPVSAKQCAWFYTRSKCMQPEVPQLTPGWFEADRRGDYEAPHLVAEAGRDLGMADDRLRRALAHAALQEGQKVGDLDNSVTIAAELFNLDPNTLRTAATSDSVRQRIAASTAEFHAHQLTQRPAFIITSSIGDKAVFSGVINRETLVNTLDSMLTDHQGYQSFSDQFGPMPTD